MADATDLDPSNGEQMQRFAEFLFYHDLYGGYGVWNPEQARNTWSHGFPDNTSTAASERRGFACSVARDLPALIAYLKEATPS